MQFELKQGTQAWLDWRRKRIMASDAPILMGVSKWSTPYQLFMDKAGFGEPKPVSDSMRRGIEIEGIARIEVEKILGTFLSPAVLQHKVYHWIGASLDGYNDHCGQVVEIKLANTDDHEFARRGFVPEHYYPQVQHQMLVADVTKMHYYSYREGDSILLEVNRDDAYCDKLLQVEKEFWDRVQVCEPPELTDRDYVRKDNDEWDYLAQRALSAQLAIKLQENILEECKVSLTQLAEGKSCIGGGIKFARTTRRGNVDYKSVAELRDVDLEQYRKAPTVFYRLMKDG